MGLDNNSPILFLSYFYGVQGCCPAEWADDKVDALSKMNRKIILVSALSSKKCSLSNVKHFRVPSFSWTDFKHEIDELKLRGDSLTQWKILLYFPFAFIFGNFMDFLQKIAVGGNGGGKWAWAITCFLCAFPLMIFYRCKVIFSTGGPASSHLAGGGISLITGKRLICELQDPLVGREIGRNENSSRLLGVVEKFVVKASSKIVYVTKLAAQEAKERYPDFSSKVCAIYPGSKKFIDQKIDASSDSKNDKLEMIHLGTLYSSRNLNTIIQAIDELISENKIYEGQISIFNLGEIYGEIKEHHLSRSYVKQRSIMPRELAVTEASTKMVSLLIQHADDRSQTTIPYKTYDYLNIGNPILGLTNSEELQHLLHDSGNIAENVSDIPNIKIVLLDLLHNYSIYKNKAKNNNINIDEQLNKLFE
ncbi:hypothetical protein [Vibrio salinus]|uniref:hypothetical protein n=1 Tax=Vibrio salinus TaxID=2899784 RepID=UPI001E4ADADB|nr:hypothetical protein [Vibrio salinus]MCE0493768.1 hypothetical protein [Vibrio salinus]